MTTGKTIALTRWTFISKVMPVLFNMQSRLVRALLPRNKHLLISCRQSPSAVILEPKKMKSVTVSIVSSSICHEVIGPDAMILVFWIEPHTFISWFYSWMQNQGSGGNLDTEELHKQRADNKLYMDFWLLRVCVLNPSIFQESTVYALLNRESKIINLKNA